MNNPRSKYKILTAIIALLFITNIALLAYMFFSKKNHIDYGKDKPGFEMILQKEVGFSDAQVQQFNTLKETHWALAKSQMEKLKQEKLNLYDLTKSASPADSQVNMLADSIASLQKQIELNSFRHFKATRDICTPAQQPAYDSLMRKIILKMGHSGPKSQKNSRK